MNDKYPENKGIFFYLGTRAENKWIYLYDKEDKENREECFTLSYDDYIDGGEINKNDYIIGNFYNVNPDYVDEFLDIDNYTNFIYYDETRDSDYDETGIDDYLDYEITPKTIDENAPHIILDSWCCNDDGSNKKTTKQVSFFNACGCIKQAYVRTNSNTNDSSVYGCELFGEDNYIDDFDGLDYDVEYLEDELDISDFDYETDNGFSLSSANDYYFYTDNKFLMFDRTPNGYTVRDWVEGNQMMYFGRKNKFKENLFILMNRTSTGYTVRDIDKLRDEANNQYDDLYNDIYNNAFAFRITDNGEIGYRYLIFDCDSENDGKYKIEEGYSYPNVISDCKWHVVHIKIVSFVKKMKLYFYVDGKLVYITKELPMFNFHKLNDIPEKQEGVPFNISIGGGTQGLAETILKNYMLEPTRTYPLEENFAGTFIGYIKSFKFYNCSLEKNIIENNYIYEKNKKK